MVPWGHKRGCPRSRLLVAKKVGKGQEMAKMSKGKKTGGNPPQFSHIVCDAHQTPLSVFTIECGNPTLK